MNGQLSTSPDSEHAPVICEWLHERHTLVYRLQATESGEQHTLDQWVATTAANRSKWHPHKPYLVLHDFTHFPVTRYAIQCAYRLARDFPPYLAGRIALATERPINEDNRAVARIMSHIQPEVGLRQFRTAQSALAWLMDYEI